MAFTYDGLGTRLKKTSGGQTTTYVGSDYEIAPDGTVTKYLLGGKQVGTEFFILHRDHLGSVRAVTDTAGAEVRSQQHTPFGDQHSVTGTHYESRGWIGEREEETELVYLNARFYDPEIGRFTAPDPIVFPGQGLNRYTYALNNPINFSDTTGLWHCYDTMCPWDEGWEGTEWWPHDWDDWADFDDDNWNDHDDYHDHPPNLGGTTTGGGNDPPDQPVPPGPVVNTPKPDNPLYNCQNGLKPNCPGKRRFLNPTESGAAALGAAQGGGFWRGLRGVLGRIWNAPNTALGLAYGAAGMAVGAAGSAAWGAVYVATFGRYGGFKWLGGGVMFGDGQIQFTGSPLQRGLGWVFTGGGSGAITLGDVGIYPRGFGPGSINPTGQSVGLEESFHSRQGRIFGPLYLPANVLGGILGLVGNGSWHGPSNFMEVGPHSVPPRVWP